MDETINRAVIQAQVIIEILAGAAHESTMSDALEHIGKLAVEVQKRYDAKDPLILDILKENGYDI